MPKSKKFSPKPKKFYNKQSALSRWDMTIPQNDQYKTVSDIHQLLRPHCNKYVFQLEKGEKTGYMHWQVRINLIKPRRPAAMTDVFPKIWKAATTNSEYRKSSFVYVMKADTRVEGPFTDKDYKEPKVLTRQLKDFMEFEMRPYQLTLENLAKQFDDRYITLIHDTVGNVGKSIFCEYLEYFDKAIEIPPMRSMEDIMAVVLDSPKSNCYVIDMPRAMKKDKLGEFYSGLEYLKNGVAYDKRYKWRKQRFDRPQVFVFTNCLPDFSLMSIDRWQIYEMQPDYSLIKRDVGHVD